MFKLFANFLLLCHMKYIIFLYINANKKFVLLYFKQLQLQLRKVSVKKSFSLKINLRTLNLLYFYPYII